MLGLQQQRPLADHWRHPVVADGATARHLPSPLRLRGLADRAFRELRDEVLGQRSSFCLSIRAPCGSCAIFSFDFFLHCLFFFFSGLKGLSRSGGRSLPGMMDR